MEDPFCYLTFSCTNALETEQETTDRQTSRELTGRHTDY